MEKKYQRICKYEGCFYYHPEAKSYCCAACSSDAYDVERLKKEEKEKNKKTR